MLFFRVTILLLLSYMTLLLFTGTEYLLLDNFNLIMHEAGHVLFWIFGTTIGFLGGSLLQLLIPLLCGFLLVAQQRDWFGAGMCGWWFGQNLVNVGRYMADAPYQRLQLIGGDHDWAFLFIRWGLLSQAEILGQVTRVIGLSTMFLTLVFLTLLVLADRLNSENN